MSTTTHQINISAVLLWVITGSDNRISLGDTPRWDIRGNRSGFMCAKELCTKASSSVNLN